MHIERISKFASSVTRNFSWLGLLHITIHQYILLSPPSILSESQLPKSLKFSSSNNKISMAKSRKGLKICCGVTALIIIILIVVAIILFFTVFKPKQPDVTLRSVNLQNIKFFPFPFLLNVSLGITVIVDNPNYGSFKYEDSTTYVTYHGTEIAEAPIEHDTIPARGTHDISTNVVIEGDKMILNPSFPGDLAAGVFNFTSLTTLHGKATALKIFKIKVKSINTCDMSLVPVSGNVTAVCTSKIKY